MCRWRQAQLVCCVRRNTVSRSDLNLDVLSASAAEGAALMLQDLLDELRQRQAVGGTAATGSPAATAFAAATAAGSETSKKGRRGSTGRAPAAPTDAVAVGAAAAVAAAAADGQASTPTKSLESIPMTELAKAASQDGCPVPTEVAAPSRGRSGAEGSGGRASSDGSGSVAGAPPPSTPDTVSRGLPPRSPLRIRCRYVWCIKAAMHCATLDHTGPLKEQAADDLDRRHCLR